MPKLSVIIPIYNVARFIERCATSLFEQTLDDIEYLFIDDCTPDNSMNILQTVIKRYQPRLAKENKVVRIMRMPTNSRQAAVRRAGIIHAKGDYIIHCDSDDWVDLDLYKKMYDKAISTGAEIVMCPLQMVFKTRIRNFIPQADKFCYDCQNVLEHWYDKTLAMFTVNKMVKRSVFSDNNILPFEGVNMWEDNGLMLRIFYYAKGLANIEDSRYYYDRTNENAITSGYGRSAVDQMLKCAQLLDEFFADKPDRERYEKTLNSIKFRARLNLVTDRFDYLKEYYHTFPESTSIIRELDPLSFSSKGKFRFLMVKNHMAWLFVLMFKVKKLLIR